MYVFRCSNIIKIVPNHAMKMLNDTLAKCKCFWLDNFLFSSIFYKTTCFRVIFLINTLGLVHIINVVSLSQESCLNCLWSSFSRLLSSKSFFVRLEAMKSLKEFTEVRCLLTPFIILIFTASLWGDSPAQKASSNFFHTARCLAFICTCVVIPFHQSSPA